MTSFNTTGLLVGGGVSVQKSSGFYSIIQIFKPGVTVQLSSATAVGATSFTLSAVTGMSVGDLLVIDTDGDSDYLTISSIASNTVTTSSGAEYAHVAGVDVFRPGAFTKTAGTPNLLMDTEIDANQGTSRGAYRVARKELQQGGIDQATFFLHKSYEDNENIQFGNWVVYGIQGGILSSDAAAGASSLSVTNLYNNTILTTGVDVLNIQSGDPIVLSDGVNTEVFIASSVTGNGPWTINLAAAPGGSSTLLNSYTAADTVKVVRLVYQGIIQNRGRTTDRKNQFQFVALGAFVRYGQVFGNSTASQVDGCSLLNSVLNSYKQTVPEIIVDAANLASSSVPVTVSEQDAAISAIIADILKQEASMVPSQSSSGLTVTPTALSFLHTSDPAQYARVNGGEAPYTASSSNANVATVSLLGSDAVNTTTVNGTVNSGATSFNVNTTTKTIGTTQTTSATGSLATGDVVLIDGGTAEAEFATIASVSGSTITVSKALTYSHADGASVAQYLSVKVTPGSTAGTATITITDAGSLQVTIQVANAVAPQSTAGTVWSVWIDALCQVHHAQTPTTGTPTKSLNINNSGNPYGDWVDTLDNTDMDGTNLMNAAIVRGGNDSTGNRLRILVREKYSRKLFKRWFEGVLDNTDINDEKQLADWAASQLAVMAYPMTSAQLVLSHASGRITTQDLLQLTGFNDGSIFIANPIEIDYVDDAQSQNTVATLTLGVLKPDVDAIAAEYARERSIRETYNAPPSTGTTGVISGLEFTKGTGLNFTISAGVISYNGTQYSVQAYSGTAPANATSYWGVQVANGSASVVQMPSAQAASLQSVQNVYEISFRGGPAVASSTFTGIPLYKVTTDATSIIGFEGIGPGSYQIGRLPASAPSFTESGTNYIANGPNSYNFTLDFSGTAQTGATGVSVYLAAHPSTSSSPKVNPQTLPLSSNGDYTVTFSGLPDGTQEYDVWGAFTDGTGNPGEYASFFTTSAFTAPPAGAGGKMPANTTALATFTDEAALNTWTHPYLIEVDFTLDASQTTALWASQLEMVFQPTNRTFLMNDAASGATSITVGWPLSVGLSNGDSITLSGGGNSESVTVSTVGTPTSTAWGTQQNTLTLSTGLVHAYSAYSDVRGPSSSTWTPCGRLPVNSGGAYTGVWAAPPYSTLSVRIIDYTGGASNVSAPLYYVPHYFHALGSTPQTGASGYTPNVISKTALAYTNEGNGAYDAQSTVTFDAGGTSSNPWISAVEYVTSNKNVTTTLNGAVSKGATSIVLAGGSGVAIGDQLTIDTGSSTEYADVAGVSGATITLAAGLQLAHGNGVSVTANAWNHYGYVPVQQGTAYKINWVSLGAGNIYQLGVRFEDYGGNTSYTVTVGTTSANPLTNTAMPGMPNGATISVANVTEAVYDGGMHTL